MNNSKTKQSMDVSGLLYSRFIVTTMNIKFSETFFGPTFASFKTNSFLLQSTEDFIK